MLNFVSAYMANKGIWILKATRLNYTDQKRRNAEVIAEIVKTKNKFSDVKQIQMFNV